MTETMATNCPTRSTWTRTRARRDDARSRAEEMAGALVPLSAGEVESMDTAYEIALDGDPTTTRRRATCWCRWTHRRCRSRSQSGERLPIIPVHLRPKALPATIAARWPDRARDGVPRGPIALVATKFGLVREPWLSRLIGKQIRWWWVPNSVALEQKAADAGELKEWEKIHRQLKATRMWRGVVLALQNLGC